MASSSWIFPDQFVDHLQYRYETQPEGRRVLFPIAIRFK